MKYLKLFYISSFLSLVYIIIIRHSEGKEVDFLVWTALTVFSLLFNNTYNQYKINRQNRNQ